MLENKIEICINTTDGQLPVFRCTVDHQEVEYTVSTHKITINVDLPMGIHKLRLTATENIKFEITDVLIDNCSLQHTLYLSYLLDSDHTRSQPATAMWQSGQTWVLPFGNPVSFWLTETGNKIPNGEYGTDLYKKYVIYYPESVRIDSGYPKIVSDFFGHDFSITVIPHEELTVNNLPFQYLDLNIDQDLLGRAIAEVNNNLDYFFNNHSEWHRQLQHNGWQHFGLVVKNQYQPGTEHLVSLRSLLDFLNIKDIHAASLSLTNPNAYIKPHIDNVTYTNSTVEDIQMQIPLSLNDDAKLKLAGVGLVPLDQPFLFNNSKYYHSLTNDSEHVRVRLLIKFNPSRNMHLYNSLKILSDY
jgi:hypothetical protein